MMNEKEIQNRIVEIAKRSGDVWQRYEECKQFLRNCERQKRIAGSDWNQYIEFVCATLKI